MLDNRGGENGISWNTLEVGLSFPRVRREIPPGGELQPVLVGSSHCTDISLYGNICALCFIICIFLRLLKSFKHLFVSNV